MIYLDQAATGFPKPSSVIEEQARCMRTYCGNPGHGSHALAMAAATKIYECRETAASFFGAESPSRVVFTLNTTMALNFAIKGLLRAGDHVLISDMEHNAVYRPIYKMADSGMITYDIFPTFVHQKGRTAEDICRAIEMRVRPNTRMLICAHASNICSAVLPLREIAALCARYGLLFVVDAAQSAGHFPIHIEEIGIDALCVPGHKGLYGPQGTGMLILRKGVLADTVLEGGSGVDSLLGMMPSESPERYEAGTLATPAIVGLCEGIKTVQSIGIDAIAEREKRLIQYLKKRLSCLRKVTVYVPHHEGSVLLFNLLGIPANALGNALNSRGICVRAGYHCSALGHQTLGTPVGGAVRVSVGYFNETEELDALVNALSDVSRNGI